MIIPYCLFHVKWVLTQEPKWGIIHHSQEEPPPMTTATPGQRRVILDVDDRGRVSLGKLGFRSMQIVADSTDDGGLIIHPAVPMTPAELAHYQDPESVAALNAALKSANEGRLSTFTLRSGPVS